MSASRQSAPGGSTDPGPHRVLRWSGSFARGFFRASTESHGFSNADEPTPKTLEWLSSGRLAFASAEQILSDPGRPRARGLLATEMYRQALHAVLVAGNPDLERRPAAEVWTARRDHLIALGLDAGVLSACEEQFSTTGSLVATSRSPVLVDPAAMREVARAALSFAERPLRERSARAVRRVAVVTLVTAVVALVAYGIFVLATTKPDLLRHASSKTSSVYSSMDPANMAFCTDADAEGPWIEFDLGKPERFSSMTIGNRIDCCQDRAVPLIVEVSSNGKTYEEITRRSHTFSVWKPVFSPVTARFLRLRVPRKTFLHLKTIQAHP